MQYKAGLSFYIHSDQSVSLGRGSIEIIDIERNQLPKIVDSCYFVVIGGSYDGDGVCVCVFLLLLLLM